MNDNLSAQTASTLMGHNPYSRILKKCYADDFDQMDLTALVHSSETVFAPTMSDLLKPTAFHIADIKQYDLTATEIVEQVLQNELYITLQEKRSA